MSLCGTQSSILSSLASAGVFSSGKRPLTLGYAFRNLYGFKMLFLPQWKRIWSSPLLLLHSGSAALELASKAKWYRPRHFSFGYFSLDCSSPGCRCQWKEIGGSYILPSHLHSKVPLEWSQTSQPKAFPENGAIVLLWQLQWPVFLILKQVSSFSSNLQVLWVGRVVLSYLWVDGGLSRLLLSLFGKVPVQLLAVRDDPGCPCQLEVVVG